MLPLCAVKAAAVILTARFHGLPVVPNLDGCAVSNAVEEEPAPAEKRGGDDVSLHGSKRFPSV